MLRRQDCQVASLSVTSSLGEAQAAQAVWVSSIFSNLTGQPSCPARGVRGVLPCFFHQEYILTKINATPANRKTLRRHAREAMAAYSCVMTWLLLADDGDLWIAEEPQGQSVYVGSDKIIAMTGGYHKAQGDGAVFDPATGRPYRTQRDYLADLLGEDVYVRIFTSSCSARHDVVNANGNLICSFGKDYAGARAYTKANEGCGLKYGLHVRRYYV